MKQSFHSPLIQEGKNSWLQVRKNTFACQPHIYTPVFSLKKNAGQFLSTSICGDKAVRLYYSTGQVVTLLHRVWMSNGRLNTCNPSISRKAEHIRDGSAETESSCPVWCILGVINSCSCIYLPRIVPLSSLVSKVEFLRPATHTHSVPNSVLVPGPCQHSLLY